MKPRKVSANSTSGGAYPLLVAHYGDDDESASGQVVLSLGPCPPSAWPSLRLAQERPRRS